MARSHRTWSLGLVTTALLCGVLTGCAAADDSDSSRAPSPSDSVTDTEVEGTDGLTTSSERFPEWEPAEVMSVPRDDFGTAVIGSEIWTLGGMTGARGNRLISIEVLDTQTGEWRTADIEMPRGLASFEVVAIGPRIYAFGGFDADSSATSFSAVLDTRSEDWRELPALPHARYAHTVTRFGKLIYVIGGRDGDGPVAEVDVFDPRTERWSTLDAPMSRPRDSHKTVATPAGLVVAGGQRDFEDSAQVDLFDPRTGEWTRWPTLPEPMSRAGLAHAGDQLWISLHESSYVLDLSGPGRRWQEANPLTLSRHGMGYVHVGGAIYAIAGCALNPLRDVRTVDRLVLR